MKLMRNRDYPGWGFAVFRRCVLLCVGCGCVSAAAAELPRSGRLIQLDGFLPEWRGDDARPWPGDSSVWWDGRITPEGVAGYFRIMAADTCAPWSFTFHKPEDTGAVLAHMSPASGSGSDGYYRVSTADSLGTVIEWILEWNTLAVDGVGGFEVVVDAVNDCGDGPSSLQLSGTPSESAPVGFVFTRRMKTRLALIAILLVLYILLRMRAGRLRKGST